MIQHEPVETLCLPSGEHACLFLPEVFLSCVYLGKGEVISVCRGTKYTFCSRTVTERKQSWRYSSAKEPPPPDPTTPQCALSLDCCSGDECVESRAATGFGV